MADSYGKYTVHKGGSKVNFWPLKTDSVDSVLSTNDADLATGEDNVNTLVISNVGVFDILIRTSGDDEDIPAPVGTTETPPQKRARLNDTLRLSTLTSAEETDHNNKLLESVSGTPPEDEMPLILETDGHRQLSRITFAVDIASGDTAFEGKLHLEGNYSHGGAKTRKLEIPIKVNKGSIANDMLIFFFIRHGQPSKKSYCWIKQKVVEQSDGTTAVDGAQGTLKVLRDNFGSGFNGIHRRIKLQSDQHGYLAYQGTERNVLGVPIEWPLLINVEKSSFTGSGYVPRGHMIRLQSSNVQHNLSAHEPSTMRMIRVSAANMSTKRVLLDPGHGVVYALTASRRSQEWFGAHRVLAKVEEMLTDASTFRLPAANLHRTRTAGFGLIHPTQISSNTAPETGMGRYNLDWPNMTIKAKVSAVNLEELSDLLLTEHDDAGTAQAVSDAARSSLLTGNPSAVSAIETRINSDIAPNRVKANSIRWEGGAVNDYVYTKEKSDGTELENAHHLSINTSDEFSITNDMLERLFKRSAIWSHKNEIGGGATFRTEARAAMQSHNVRTYMFDAMKAEGGATPAAFRSHGSRGWGPSRRNTFMNGLTPTCDVHVTLHLNASAGGVGSAMLVKDGPSADHLRVAKIFAKYLDAFDQGLRQGGIVEKTGVSQLGSGNHVFDQYVYIETEFMDTRYVLDPTQFQYALMLESDFAQRVARQIVAAIVEIMFDKDDTVLDAATYKGNITPAGVGSGSW